MSAASDKRPGLEVLVATMGRQDMSLAQEMKLTKDAVIANQCERWGFEEKTTESGRVRMISTRTKGVGINRNLAIQLSEAEILLFADDDIAYYDGALEGVEAAFRALPDADVIFFAIDMTRDGVVFDRRRNPVKRLRIWNSLKFGACRMAVRRDAIVKKRISFSTLFGGGGVYSHGEDTVFICDCLRAGLKVYCHELVLGACAKDSSTWFAGYNEKYCFDKGALLACAFPKAKHFVKWYFVLKLRKMSGKPIGVILKLMNRGIRAFETLTPYTEQVDN